MTPPHANVPDCLLRSWKFLTRRELQFTSQDTASTQALVEPSRYDTAYLIALTPQEYHPGCGVAMLLDSACFDRVTDDPAEICNVFSGCMSVLFPENRHFDTGLPQHSSAQAIRTLLAESTIQSTWLSTRSEVLVIAFRANHKIG